MIGFVFPRLLYRAQLGIAADPDLTFAFLGTYQRLARCWALAVAGTEPGRFAAEAHQLIDSMLLNPPGACVSTWFGLLAEMHLAAGAQDAAGAALDRAEQPLDRYGQRYAEGLILLNRAWWLHNGGAPDPVVRAAAVRARDVAVGQEAHLFVRRVDDFTSRLPE